MSQDYPVGFAAGAAAQPRDRQPIVERAQQLMAANPSAAHRIAELAGELGVSPSHLAHVFRASVGVSVHQYLLRLRMEIAVLKLCEGGTSLSRLAADLGFSSHSHFSSVFRKHFGAGPAQWSASEYQDR